MSNNTITLSEVSVASVGRSIAQLSKAFNSNAEKIDVIQATIMVGFEQSDNFDTTGNAYCQKAAALTNAVAKFSPDRAKRVITFFKGKIPFSIVSNGEGGFKLSKLNWDLIKAPEVLQAEHDKKSADAKTRADKRKADNAETVAKAARFDSIQEELKRLKAENAELKTRLAQYEKSK